METGFWRLTLTLTFLLAEKLKNTRVSLEVRFAALFAVWLTPFRVNRTILFALFRDVLECYHHCGTTFKATQPSFASCLGSGRLFENYYFTSVRTGEMKKQAMTDNIHFSRRKHIVAPNIYHITFIIIWKMLFCYFYNSYTSSYFNYT